MTLEDPELVRAKNRKRLVGLKRATFLFGINITAPSPLKDSLRIITVILIVGNFMNMYGQMCFILHFKHSIVLIAECMCLLLQTLISDFKLAYLLFVQHRFYKILYQVETHELVFEIEYLSKETSYNRSLRHEVQRILNDCWRIAMRQSNYYMGACSAICGYYFLYSQGFNFYNWYIGNPANTYIFPFPALFPPWQERMNELPYYLALTSLSITANITSGAVAFGFDGMFIIIALHGVALIRILRRMIVHTTSKDIPPNLRLHVLRQCIDHYEKTIQFCNEFNDLYFHITILQFLLSLVILGVVMFQASVGLETDKVIVVRMMLYMGAAGYEVVIYCLNGQFVFNEYEDLPFAWYDCEWYNETKEFKRLIQMMIMRTNRGFMMRASYFSTLSLPTFMDLIRTSGSYFLLLRKFKD